VEPLPPKDPRPYDKRGEILPRWLLVYFLVLGGYIELATLGSLVSVETGLADGLNWSAIKAFGIT
jgi:hypothetical protein